MTDTYDNLLVDTEKQSRSGLADSRALRKPPGEPQTSPARRPPLLHPGQAGVGMEGELSGPVMGPLGHSALLLERAQPGLGAISAALNNSFQHCVFYFQTPLLLPPPPAINQAVLLKGPLFPGHCGQK